MESLKALIKKEADIDQQIITISKALSGCPGSKESMLSVGNHYNRVAFNFNDKDLRDVLELKKSKFEAELLPITERLKILNELACETLKEPAPAPARI